MRHCNARKANSIPLFGESTVALDELLAAMN
jgi:hypothetical protein